MLIKEFLGGLKFGMILQMAIGPMCLMVFNTAKNIGFLTALALVSAIVLIDALYITLSCVGVSKLLQGAIREKLFRLLGACVLIFFGLNIILSVWEIHMVPGFNLKPSAKNIFLQGLVLTLSNPMTIIFWTGVLTGKIIEKKLKGQKLAFFACGLVTASCVFLSFVALLGTVCHSFLSEGVSNILNIFVGLFIIFFGIKLWLSK